MQRGWSEYPAPSVPAGEIEQFVVEQIRTIGKDPVLLKQTSIDVQERNQVESKRLRDEQKSLARQMRDDLWQSLPPKEQVRVVRLLIDSVNFDGPGGNVAITFHPTGLKTLTETQLEHAQ